MRQALLLLAAIGTLSGCERTRTPDSGAKWTSRVVMPPGDLTIRCDASTSGQCLLRIEDRGRERAQRLGVGASQRFTGISPDARTCVVAEADAACDWRPIKPAVVP